MIWTKENPPSAEIAARAEKLRYSRSVLHLIPLDGLFAVQTSGGSIVGYCTSIDEAKQISREAYASWDRQFPNAALGFVSRKAKLSPIEIDLDEIIL
jgi:hypothetical protein